MSDIYDILVIGSGESGKYLAWAMAAAGRRTAVIERKLIGGSCPNVACLPSKNIIHSAKVKSLASRAGEFGLDVGAISTDMKAVQERKRAMVADLIKVHIGRIEVRAVVTLASPFSGDLKTNTNVRGIYERIAGHDVNKPPFERHAEKPPVPTLALWGRRDGIVAPSAARGLATEVDKAVEIDTNHMGFAVYRPALSRVVHEIRIFLTEMEGKPPELTPMAAATPATDARVVATS